MKKLPLIILLFCLGCTTKPSDPEIKIGLIDSGRALKISGLNYAVMQDVSSDTTNTWENLLEIYRMPADTDMKDFQPMQPGKYQLKDSALVFSPDTPFAKQQTYFLRYYQYNEIGEISGFIKGERKAGKVAYTDLIFSPKPLENQK